MKSNKYLKIYFASFLISFIFGCSKEGDYKLEELPPLDFKVYYNGLSVSFVSTSEDATNVSWDFGDKSSAVSGDSVVHKFSTVGKYLISMNAKKNGKDYTFHTVLRVDKPSVIDLHDNSFEDWDKVTYPDFQLAGKGAVKDAKIDYDANYIYFYVAFDSVAINAGLSSHIIGIYMDTDNSLTTGFSLKGIGVDYALEGNLFAGWTSPSIVDLVKGAAGWPFVAYSPSIESSVAGTFLKSGNTIKMEFAISREAFKIEKDAFQFTMSIMNSDWSDVGNVTTLEFSEKIQAGLNKE